MEKLGSREDDLEQQEDDLGSHAHQVPALNPFLPRKKINRYAGDVDPYDSLLLLAYSRISDRVRPTGWPRTRWEVLVDGEWVKQPARGRPNSLLITEVRALVDAGELDMDDPAIRKAVKKATVNSSYPRMSWLMALLIDHKIYRPY